MTVWSGPFGGRKSNAERRKTGVDKCVAVFTREEGRRRLEPLMDGLIGEAMVMDFSQEELREAFDKKLSQCQWNFKKGADSNNE